MLAPKVLLPVIALVLAASSARAEGVVPDANDLDAPLITLQEGRIYRTVNGQPILGKDVVDLLLEEKWDSQLQLFVEHQLRLAELQNKQIDVSDADVDAELQSLLTIYANRLHQDPAQVKLDKIANLFSGMAMLRQTTRENLALLRLFQRAKLLKADVHTSDQQFQSLLRERLDKCVSEKGVLMDPKKLGPGEAVRIGTRSFARDEVRQFAAETLCQMTLKELKEKLEILTLGRLVDEALKEKKLDLTEADLEFHYSYLCCRAEAEKGVPGRALLNQEIRRLGMTTEQYLHSRKVRYNAGITRLAKERVHRKDLETEFAAHPERYKRNENLIAHIFIRVLDPEGKPYEPGWELPDGGPANMYAAKLREEQFAAAKAKIDALVAAAHQDFVAAAKQYSDDHASAGVGGRLARIGPETIPVKPWDKQVRDAAIKLKPGEISAPVRSDYGWHILKCLEQQEVTFDEAAEHIYINLIHEENVKIDAALRANAKIEDKFE